LKFNQYKIRAKVWVYPGMAGWYFITIPKDISEDIKKLFGDKQRGWGSLPVEMRVGKTVWKTSIFFDKKKAAFLLPLKKEVRTKENIDEGKNLEILLEIKA
jgi:hypothetical protein